MYPSWSWSGLWGISFVKNSQPMIEILLPIWHSYKHFDAQVTKGNYSLVLEVMTQLLVALVLNQIAWKPMKCSNQRAPCSWSRISRMLNSLKFPLPLDLDQSESRKSASSACSWFSPSVHRCIQNDSKPRDDHDLFCVLEFQRLPWCHKKRRLF